MKLNLGCGPVQPAGWVNVDGSLRAWSASRLAWLDRAMVAFRLFPPTEFGTQVKVFDLLKRFPYADGTVDAIYAGEVWEHFERPDSERVTHECFRVLKPGGVLRVCVPDDPAFWTRYLDLVRRRDAKALSELVGLYFQTICTRRLWFGSMGHYHKWAWDEVQLIDLFQSVGLVEVERRKFHDSRIEGIGSVERSDLLIVEGVKTA